MPASTGFHDVGMCIEVDSVASESYPEFDSFFQEEDDSAAARGGVGKFNSNSNQSQSTLLVPALLEADSTIGTRLKVDTGSVAPNGYPEFDSFFQEKGCSSTSGINSPVLVEDSLEPLKENMTSTADEPYPVEGIFSQGIKRQRSEKCQHGRNVARRLLGNSFSDPVGPPAALDVSEENCTRVGSSYVSDPPVSSGNLEPLIKEMTSSADDPDFDEGIFHKGLEMQSNKDLDSSCALGIATAPSTVEYRFIHADVASSSA